MRTPALALLAILLLVTLAGAEDLIRFTNGRSLSGRIVKETPADVTVELPGGGSLTVPRTLIQEIVRDVPKESAEPGAAVEGILKSEYSFVWSGDRRLGTRSLVSRRLEGGDLQIEEETVFLREDGAEDVRVRLVERAGADFGPKEVLYRETSEAGSVLLRGEVRGRSLELTLSLPGERRPSVLTIPEGMRFPLSAREAAIGGSASLSAPLETPVFDPREQSFLDYRYSLLGTRQVEWDGAPTEVRVVERRRGERAREEIWIDTAGRCLSEEVNGPRVVSVLSSRERVEAFLAGGKVAPSDEEQRIRPEFVHPEAGFKVRKPTLSWSFDPPAAGARKVLSLSNLRYFAYVDFLVLPETPESDQLPALALQMEKRFSASSEGYRKLSEGYFEVGGVNAVRVVARSRNKGEEIRSLLVGFARGGRTWFIAMACPDACFEQALPEFEEILASVQFLK